MIQKGTVSVNGHNSQEKIAFFVKRYKRKLENLNTTIYHVNLGWLFYPCYINYKTDETS